MKPKANRTTRDDSGAGGVLAQGGLNRKSKIAIREAQSAIREAQSSIRKAQTVNRK